MLRKLSLGLVFLTLLAGSTHAVLQGHEMPEILTPSNARSASTADLSLKVAHYVRTLSWAVVAALTGWKGHNTEWEKVISVNAEQKALYPDVKTLGEYKDEVSLKQLQGKDSSQAQSTVADSIEYIKILNASPKYFGTLKKTIPGLAHYPDVFFTKLEDACARHLLRSNLNLHLALNFSKDKVGAFLEGQALLSKEKTFYSVKMQDIWDIEVSNSFQKLSLYGTSIVSALLAAWSYKNPPAVEAGKVRTPRQKAVTAVSSGAELLGAAYLAIKQPELLGRSASWAAASALASQAYINLRTWWLETHAVK